MSHQTPASRIQLHRISNLSTFPYDGLPHMHLSKDPRYQNMNGPWWQNAPRSSTCSLRSTQARAQAEHRANVKVSARELLSCSADLNISKRPTQLAITLYASQFKLILSPKKRVKRHRHERSKRRAVVCRSALRGAGVAPFFEARRRMDHFAEALCGIRQWGCHLTVDSNKEKYWKNIFEVFSGVE
jgi:hypothetical protein